MVISPEHPLIDKYKDEITNWDEIQKYREMSVLSLQRIRQV